MVRTLRICASKTCRAMRTLTVFIILPAETTMPARVRGVGAADIIAFSRGLCRFVAGGWGGCGGSFGWVGVGEAEKVGVWVDGEKGA